MRCSHWNRLVLSMTLAALAAGCSWKTPFAKKESVVPTAPNQSTLTHAPSSLSPKPSVTIPQATSPAGAAGESTGGFFSRFYKAGASASEALAFKPREGISDDPTKLGGTPKDVAAPVYVSAARVYEAQNRNDEAAEQYKKALAADANNLDAMLGFARLKHRTSDMEGAVQLYQQAIKKHPQSAVAHNDFALCLAKRGQVPQALDLMQQAVTIDPRSKLYRNNFALVLVEAGRTPDAQAQLMAVHSEPVAHYNLAYLLHEKGRNEEAKQHLQIALQLEPALEPARLLIARLDAAAQPAVQYAQRIQEAAAPVFNPQSAPPQNGQYVGPSNQGPAPTNSAPQNGYPDSSYEAQGQNSESASRWNNTNPSAPPATNPFYQ